MANYVSNLTVQVGDNSSATYNIRELFPHVGTCSTAAATAAKEVTIGNFKLYTGAWVVVKFNNTNSAAVASLTLNVDGTGAKPIKYRNANLGGAGDLAANRYTMFIYDGTNYQIVMDFNSNTYDRTSQQTRIYAGTIGVFNYSLCAMDNNQRMQSFTTTSGTGTAKTFNTSASFMYPVVIMYNAANSTYADGTAIANNVLYEQYPSVDLRYSCNVTSTAGFTQYKPVYLECTINSDGTFKLTTTGLTQTFTNGKYYILLGCMYNTSIYQLALFAQHPMFYYDGTHLNGIVYTAAEKTKLSGIANGATKVESSSNGKIKINGTDTTVYTHPSHTSKTSGLYKITVDSLGHVSATAAVAKGDIPALDYSKVSISRSLTSGTKIGSITIDGTSTDLYCQTNTNTDTLVSQTFATADHNRPLLMSYYDTGIETTTAQIVHRNDALFFNPSSGILRSPRLHLQTPDIPITINLHTLQPTAGENVNLLKVLYKNTDGTVTHTVFPIGILGNDATGSSANYNSGVRLGSTNGTTIVGAGESSVTFAAAQAKYNDESLYLVADQAVYMYTNCSNDSTTVTGPWRVGGFTTGTAAITSGRVMITDGTTGGFKASDYTIAKSVPSDAKFSDTVTTVTTSGSGNAVTSITASNGALTVTKGSTFSLSNHTHNYAGSSSAGGAATSANKINTNAGATNRPVYFSGGVPVQCDTPGSGSWFKGVPLIGTDGVMEIGKYIDFHGSDTSTADYDLRLEYASTTTGHKITIPPISAAMAVDRKALITDSSDNFASYAWHKFAEVTITSTNYDYFTTFVVSSGFDVSSTYATKKIGLLTMHVRTGSTRIFAQGQLEWLVAGEQIDPNNFVMVHTDTANTSCKVELWYKQLYRYEGFTFTILEEHTRTVKNIYTMTLYDASGHGSAAYTTGSGNPIISKLGKIKNAPGIYAVKGTQTTATSAWTGKIDVSELYDGLTIAYYLPYAATSTSVTLNLTLSDGSTTGAINCYYNNTSRITSHYGAGSTVILTYWSAGSISVSGTATTDNRWTRCDYNSNSSVTQNIASGSANRPLLMSYYQTGTAVTAAQVVYRNDLIYANPSTGAITANKFYGDITGSGLNAGIYDLLNIDDPIFDGAEWMLTSIPSSSGGTSTPSFRRVKTAKFADYVNSVSRNVLFNDSTNTSKSITLSTPPTDTQYLKLYFKSSGNSGQSTMDNSVYSIAEVPYMTDVNLGGILQVAQPSDNMGVLKSTVLAFTIKITNHTLTLTKASYPSRLDGSVVANDTHLSANIIKVVAYR